MKAILSILLILVFVSPALADDVESVTAYCSSEALEAGFKDRPASFFCEELGKRGAKKKSFSITQTRESAGVVIQFLAKESISERGEATYLIGGYAWTPDQIKTGVRAVVSVGKFNKGFHGKGVNDAAYVDLRDQVESWIRENRATILEKASQK